MFLVIRNQNFLNNISAWNVVTPVRYPISVGSLFRILLARLITAINDGAQRSFQCKQSIHSHGRPVPHNTECPTLSRPLARLFPARQQVRRRAPRSPRRLQLARDPVQPDLLHRPALSSALPVPSVAHRAQPLSVALPAWRALAHPAAVVAVVAVPVLVGPALDVALVVRLSTHPVVCPAPRLLASCHANWNV